MTRSLPLRRTLAALAVSPLLVTGLAACGNDGSSGAAPTSASDSNSQSTQAADTGLTAGQQVPAADFLDTVSQGIDKSTTAHMTMSIAAGSAGKMTAAGDVDYTTKPPSLAMTMSLPGSGGQMEIRTVDGIVYMSMGQLTQGKFWKLDPNDPKGPFASLGMGQLMDQMDPAKTFQSMGDAITKVVYVGPENGLDHYTMTVDMKKAMESMAGKLPQEAQSQMPATLTYDVWLDNEDRLAKMRMDDLPMGGSNASMEMTVSDWGKDVNIQAPPASQITKMPDFGSMMGSAQPSA